MAEPSLELLTVVLIDQRERWRNGDKPSVETYLRKIPELGSDRNDLLDFIYQEVLLREESGDAPSVDEYIRRFPDLNQDLRQQFEVHAALPAEGPLPAAAKEEEALPRIDGFVISEPIGRGSFGAVYRAWERSLNRTVALKVPHELSEPGKLERERFLAEAHSAARLTHPNIVQIHAVGSASGRSYFCLEYVEGGTLADFLNRRPQPFRESAELMATLAEAVHYAHLCQVVHCDLKPGNVLLQHRSEEMRRRNTSTEATTASTSTGLADYQPKIADFGLARRLDAEAGIEMDHLSGTLPYMAPEQLSRNSGKIGPATDIYGLGAILYEMLTGRPPFVGDSQLQVYLQARDESPTSVKAIRPDVPPDLQAICEKCLARKPEDRYPSALALSEDLKRFVDGREVSVRPLPFWERANRWRRRNPLSASLIGLLIVGSILSFAVVTSKMLQAQQAERSERQRADELDAALYLNQFLRAFQSWQNRDVVRAKAALQETNPTRRSFEWNYLQRLLNDGRDQWPTTQKEVGYLTYSPDGKSAAVADRMESVQIIDALTGKLQRTISGHTIRLSIPVFSPDGTQLASAGMDKSQSFARIGDVKTGAETKKFGPLNGAGLAVAFQENGKKLLTVSMNESLLSFATKPLEIDVWDIATGRRLSTIKGPPTHSSIGAPRVILSGDGRYFAWIPDGMAALAFRKKPTVHLGETSTGKILQTWESKSGLVRSVFNPDGTRIAILSDDGSVVIRNVADGRVLLNLKGHSDAVFSAAFSTNGKLLATGSRDQSIIVWDAESGARLNTFRGHTDIVWGIAFSPDGQSLLASAESGTLSRWKMGARNVAAVAVAPAITEVVLSPDAQDVITAHLGKTTQFRDWALPTHPVMLKRDFADIAISQDGSRMAAIDSTGKLWLTPSGKPLTDLTVLETTSPLNAAGSNALAWFADSKRLAVVLPDKVSINIIDAGTGKVLAKFVTPHNRINALATRDDHQQIAVLGFEDSTVTLWNPATGLRIRSITAAAPIRSLAYRPASHELATIPMQGRTSDVWNTNTGERRLTVAGHKFQITCLVFTPDGKRLITGSNDRTVKVWDAESGTELLTLEDATHGIRQVAFSSDGGFLAAGSGAIEDLFNGELLVWDASLAPALKPNK